MASIPVIGPIFRLALKIVSILVWALTIFAAYGGRFNTEYFSLPAVICLALPYLAILSGILIIYWLITRKLIFAALGILAIIACIDPLSLTFPLNSPKKHAPGVPSFKIISWNILHTEDLRKPDYQGNRSIEFLVRSGADIICLAELDNFTTDLQNVSAQLKDSLFNIYPYRTDKTQNDLKVLSKYPVEPIDNSDIASFGDRRFDFYKIDYPRHPLTVCVTHLYSYDLSEEERQIVSDIKSVKSARSSVEEFKGTIFQKMRNAFRRRAENAKNLRKAIDRTTGPLIVCGDFNDVPESWVYNIIRGDDMHDAYVETNFGPTFTYNHHLFLFHIDQMLYRGPLRALSLSVDKINCSDHYPLVGEFEFTNQ